MTLQLTNPAAWARSIKAETALLEKEGQEELAGLGRDMAKLMRDGAPVMPEEERRDRQASETGRSRVRRSPGRSTIRSRRGRDRQGFYVDVGANKSAFYLAFHEWGTSKMTARPWMRPAIESAIARWASKGQV